HAGQPASGFSEKPERRPGLAVARPKPLHPEGRDGLASRYSLIAPGATIGHQPRSGAQIEGDPRRSATIGAGLLDEPADQTPLVRGQTPRPKRSNAIPHRTQEVRGSSPLSSISRTALRRDTRLRPGPGSGSEGRSPR